MREADFNACVKALAGAASDEAIHKEYVRLREMHAGRAYHNWHHIEQAVEVATQLLEGIDAVEQSLVLIALTYHDSVYELGPKAGGASSNEELSATHAIASLKELEVATEHTNQIARLIRLTQQHDTGEHDTLGQAVIDADLSILAAESDEYNKYSQGIAEEFSWAGETYSEGRAEFLKAMIKRASARKLFHAQTLDHMRAASNMQRELDKLQRRDSYCSHTTE